MYADFVSFPTCSRIAEQLCLKVRGLHLQEISCIAAMVEANAALRVVDQSVFRRRDRQRIAEIPLLHMTGVEQETVCGDSKQGFRVLPHIGGEEIVDVLRGKQYRRVFLSHSLHGVADILDGGQVGKKQVLFFHRIPFFTKCNTKGHRKDTMSFIYDLFYLSSHP